MDGFFFDSLIERSRYCELKLLQQAKAIRDLVVHPRWKLEQNGVSMGYYKADFAYWEIVRMRPEEFVVEDVKSSYTAKQRGWERVKKLMLLCHGIRIREVIR
jgi:hypothetical protein